MMKLVSQVLWVFCLLLVGCYGVTLSFSVLAVCALLAAVAGVLCVPRIYQKGWDAQWVDGLVVVAAGYFGWRCWQSPVWDLAKEDLLLLGLGLMVYGCLRVQRFERLSWVVLALVVAANAVLFVVQKLSGAVWIPIDGVSEVGGNTVSFGMHRDYGGMASALALCGFVGVSFALFGRRAGRVLRLISLGVALVALALVLFSGSRSAILSVGVGSAVLFVVLWLQAGKLSWYPVVWVRGALVGMGALCMGGLVLVGQTSFRERDARFAAVGEVSESNVRSDYWGMAYDQVLQAPLFGNGARSYRYGVLEYWDGQLPQYSLNPEFVHNEYLQTLCDYGVVGLMLLVAVLLWHWASAFLGVTGAGVIRWRCMAGLLGMTVFMVHALTDFSHRLPFVFCLSALCAAWSVPARREEAEVGRIQRSGVALLMLVAALSVGVFSAREVWGAAPLLLSQQAREDGAWEAHGHEELLEEYQLANQRVADYRRSERIGMLLHQAAGRGDEAACERAMVAYRESLTRNPWNVLVGLNMAKLHARAGWYAEADVLFAEVVRVLSAQDTQFRVYLDWAHNAQRLAGVAYDAGDLADAGRWLERAGEIARMGVAERHERNRVERDSYVGRVRILVEMGDYLAAEKLTAEMRKKVVNGVITEENGRAYGEIAQTYWECAYRVWWARNPEVAVELFQKAAEYSALQQRLGGAVPEGRLADIQKRLELLRQAGFLGQ